jgi:hypothetical protein
MWEALTDLVRRKAEYYRTQTERAQNPKAAPEGCAAWLTAIGTWAAVIAALIAACIFWRQWQTGQATLNEMQAEQRAWMKPVEVTPLGRAIDNIALSYLGKSGDLGLRITIKNVGHSPAFNVRVGAWPFYPGMKGLENREQIDCASLDQMLVPASLAINDNFVKTIFPDDSHAATSVGVFLNERDIPKHAKGNPPEIAFGFYGCIRYMLPGSPEQHETGFAYRVSRIVDANIPGGKAQGAFPIGTEVSADRILLTPVQLAVELAN